MINEWQSSRSESFTTITKYRVNISLELHFDESIHRQLQDTEEWVITPRLPPSLSTPATEIPASLGGNLFRNLRPYGWQWRSFHLEDGVLNRYPRYPTLAMSTGLEHLVQLRSLDALAVNAPRLIHMRRYLFQWATIQ